MAVIIGAQKALRNLNRELGKIEGRTAEGMALAAHQIKNDAQERTPVKYGNLKNSAFADPPITKRGLISAIIGYTALYAPWVHENLNAFHSNGENKFLEKAITAGKNKILKIVRDRAKIR